MRSRVWTSTLGSNLVHLKQKPINLEVNKVVNYKSNWQFLCVQYLALIETGTCNFPALKSN